MREMPQPKQIDWARLAAYIDGEGTIYINRQNPAKSTRSVRHFLSVVVTSSSGTLMRWLRGTFTGTIYSVAPNHWGKKPVFRWQLNERTAEWVLTNCVSYLLIKREQAEIGLAFRKSKGDHRYGAGVKLEAGVLADRDEFSQKIRDLNSRPDPLETVQ